MIILRPTTSIGINWMTIASSKAEKMKSTYSKSMWKMASWITTNTTR